MTEVLESIPEMAIPLDDNAIIPQEIATDEIEVESVIIKRYYDRMINQNKNWLAIMTGSTGSGKSYSALSIAETLDPTFCLERVVFTPQDFMKLFDEGKVGKGQIVIWEEAGVTMGARDFQSRVNKAINYFIQSFRSKNTGVIFTLPSMMMIDTQIRNLAHTLMQPIGLDKENKLAIIKVLEIFHNPVSGDTYQKYIRAFVNGGVYKVNRVAVRIPSMQLRKDYEKKKEEFLQKLAGDTLSKISDENKEPLTINANVISDFAHKLLGNPKAYEGRSKRMTVNSVSLKLDISFANAQRVLEKYHEIKKDYEERIMREAIFPLQAPHHNNGDDVI